MASVADVAAGLDHLPMAVALPVAKLSVATGLPSDQLLFVISTLLCIPLGWAHRFVPGIFLKHLTTLILGVTIVYLIVGWGFLHQLISSFIVYVVTETFLPHGKLSTSTTEPATAAAKLAERQRKRNTVGTGIFAFSMLYMCVCHIYRLYTDYLGYAMDFTAPQMVLTLKLVSYAWSRVDGENMNDGVSLLPSNPSEPEKQNAAYREERAIREQPSLLAYFAWVFFFPGVFAGPAIDFNEYDLYTKKTLYKKFGLKDAPFLLWPALQKVGYALMCYPFMLVGGMYPINGWCNTEAFYKGTSVWYRVGYVTLFNALARYKYYFAWYLCEAGCVAFGLGLTKYDPKTSETEWNGMTNCRASLVETATSTGALTAHWNIRTSDWLKHNVFYRVKEVPPFLSKIMSAKTFANVLTKFTSAFWHGFYPGYYLFFLQLVLVQQFEAVVKAVMVKLCADKENTSNSNTITPKTTTSTSTNTTTSGTTTTTTTVTTTGKPKPKFTGIKKYIYNIVMYTFIMGSFNWLGASFVLLEATATIRLLVDSYFWYHILGIVLCYGILPNFLRKSKSGSSSGSSGSIKHDKEKVVSSATIASPYTSPGTSPAVSPNGSSDDGNNDSNNDSNNNTVHSTLSARPTTSASASRKASKKTQ